MDPDDRMETLSQAMTRLRGDGWREDWYAHGDGLRCGGCGAVHDPSDVNVDHMLRFEGTSDPGDESVLFAITGPCGHKGLYSLAYGADTPPEDLAVVTALPEETHRQ